MTTTGELVGYLRLDTSEWDRKADEAKAKIAGLRNPTIKVQADTASAIAKLEAVRAATLRVSAAEKDFTDAQTKHGAASKEAQRAEAALISARGAATNAALAAAKAEHTLADETERGDQKTFSFRQNLYSLIAFLGQTAAPILMAGAGLIAGFGAAGAVAILGIMGMHDALKKGGPVAAEFGATLHMVKNEFITLKQIAAENMLGGFTSALKELQPAFGFVNQLVANFGVIIGRAAANLVPGLIAVLQQLVPLFNLAGRYLLQWSSAFTTWATTSGSLRKFVDYAVQQIPIVLHTLGDLVVALVRIAQATSPFGGIILHAIDAFAKALNAIPIGVLEVLVPTIITLNAAMKGLAIIQVVSKNLVEFAVKLGLVETAEVGLRGATAALLTTFGPLVAGIGIVLALGPAVTHLSQALANLLTGGPQSGQTPKSLDWLGSARSKVVDFGKSLLGMGGHSHVAAAAIGNVQTQTISLIGAQTKAGLVVDGVTYSLDKQNTAATILKNSLDRLNGASMNLEQAQNSFYDSLGQLQKRTGSYNGTLSVLNDTGRKNREAIVQAMQAANQHAQAMVDEKSKTEAAGAALRAGVSDFKQHETAIRKAATAAGLDKGEVDKLINSIGKVPSLKVARIDVRMSGADQVAILKQNIAALKSRQITMTTYLQNVILPTLGTPSVTHDTHHAEGGYISGAGTGTSDSIFARLSNGEFVMNANATAAFRPMLERMNSMVPAFAGGGLAAPGPVMTTSTVVVQPVVNLNVAGSIRSDRDIVDMIVSEVDARRRRRGDISIIDSWSGQRALQTTAIGAKTTNVPGLM